MIFAIALAALLGNGLHQAMFAVGILLAPGFYRLTRAAALGRRRPVRHGGRADGRLDAWVLRRTCGGKILPVIVVTTASDVAPACSSSPA